MVLGLLEIISPVSNALAYFVSLFMTRKCFITVTPVVDFINVFIFVTYGSGKIS
jgi:hypothetical protein